MNEEDDAYFEKLIFSNMPYSKESSQQLFVRIDLHMWAIPQWFVKEHKGVPFIDIQLKYLDFRIRRILAIPGDIKKTTKVICGIGNGILLKKAKDYIRQFENLKIVQEDGGSFIVVNY